MLNFCYYTHPWYILCLDSQGLDEQNHINYVRTEKSCWYDIILASSLSSELSCCIHTVHLICELIFHLLKYCCWNAIWRTFLQSYMPCNHLIHCKWRYGWKEWLTMHVQKVIQTLVLNQILTTRLKIIIISKGTILFL